MCWTTKPLVIAHRIEDANEVRDARTAADLPQRVERLTAPVTHIVAAAQRAG
jgi:hypothetical protein